MALSESAAERHRQVADHFGEVAGGVTDWAASAPVPDWTARDVVGHLVEWFPGFLSGGGVTLARTSVSVADDPVAAWTAHTAAVQELFDQGDREFAHPMAGTHRLADAIDMFYTSDVFMHTWDLAKAAGVDPALDPDFAGKLLNGMQPIDEVLRSSGQYGPKMPVSPDAPVQDQLMAFVGRDPAWTASGQVTRPMAERTHHDQQSRP
jgi:uncharacterized protein (TIGR03086 family)